MFFSPFLVECLELNVTRNLMNMKTNSSKRPGMLDATWNVWRRFGVCN